jgi:hypothetical protein
MAYKIMALLIGFATLCVRIYEESKNRRAREENKKAQENSEEKGKGKCLNE